MEGFSEQIIDIKNTDYVNYQPKDWALLWIEIYGGIDGAHHKQWLLDQVVRILLGTTVILTLAKWSNGETEERFILDEPNSLYYEWVIKSKNGEDGPDTYDYDCGIAP